MPKGLPALQRAARVIERATNVGFQWSDLQGPLAKIDEELKELKDEIAAGAPKEKIEAEIGDLLFSVANVAYLTKVTPEDALRGTLARFDYRFRHMEKRLAETGRKPKDATLEEMDKYWDEAKKLDHNPVRRFPLGDSLRKDRREVRGAEGPLRRAFDLLRGSCLGILYGQHR